MERIKEVLNRYHISQKDLADRLGISPQAVNSRLKNPKLNSLKEFADAIGCDIHELIQCSDDFAHFYDDKQEWLGIRKK